MTWLRFTKRTDDPKLAYLEWRLTEAGIPHRRRGYSWHAPITEVPLENHAQAYAMLGETVGMGDPDDPQHPDADDPGRPAGRRHPVRPVRVPAPRLRGRSDSLPRRVISPATDRG